MSADDQQFLDILNEARRYACGVADFFERQIDSAAGQLRETQIVEQLREILASQEWIPDGMRPRGTPRKALAVPTSFYERIEAWISRHKILTGFVVLTTGAIVYRGYKRSVYIRKTRRARRAKNGARLDVVVVAGSPNLPLTKALSLDLERRGFVVYISCNTLDEEVVVQNLSRPDIRPLGIDITDPPKAGTAIEGFAQFLQASHAAVPGAKPHHLNLKSVILIPSMSYQTSPIATIPPSSFADLFDTHLLHPILTIQAFLPLLTARLTSASEKSPPKVMVLTPSIISSINPPFHAPEATVCSALSAFTDVLAGELRPLSIPVTHVQLGTFDFTGFTGPASAALRRSPGLLPAADSAETLAWPEPARHAYGRNFINTSSSAISAGRIRGMRGGSLKDLHRSIFDIIDGSNKSSVVRVGLGADLYGFVGKFVPRSLVQWMMGMRRIDELASYYPNPKAGSEMGDGYGFDFVSVHPEPGRSNPWKDG
ncbi:hypothetical protein N0V82_005796 [Gnomoniopsis sp. IMI 355080]|nr:hypothetical protein N0V82_005796 [Gnomoniopsis sp. IMI 355080]